MKILHQTVLSLSISTALFSASLFSIVLPSARAYATPPTQRIVGGVAATKGEFPFIVSLQENDSFPFCGGSLIAKNWVLTAAHCMVETDPSAFKIVAGLHKQGDLLQSQTLHAKKIIVHPQYGIRTQQDSDYALIQLDSDSRFAPIALNEEEIGISEVETEAPKIITAGWGTTSQSGPASKVLLKVELPLASFKRCDTAYPAEITDTMICAGPELGGKDSCQGDSGGPLFFSSPLKAPLLVGVVSWGEGCAQPQKYGVYSKVSAGVSWIREQMALNP